MNVESPNDDSPNVHSSNVDSQKIDTPYAILWKIIPAHNTLLWPTTGCTLLPYTQSMSSAAPSRPSTAATLPSPSVYHHQTRQLLPPLPQSLLCYHQYVKATQSASLRQHNYHTTRDKNVNSSFWVQENLHVYRCVNAFVKEVDAA